MMTPDQYLSEIADLAADAQDAHERGDTDGCMTALDYILENVWKAMKLLDGGQ